MGTQQLEFLEMRMYMLALPAFVLGGVVLLAHLLLAGRSARTFWVGWGFILVGLLALVTSLVARGLQPATPRLPLTTMFEITVLVQMGAAGTLLVVLPRAKELRSAGPFVLAVVAALWAYGYSKHSPPEQELVPALKSAWLQIHVATAVLSYGPLFMSGVTAAMATVMYLVGGRYTEPRLPAEDGGEALPSVADRFEEWTYRIIAFGFPWLTALIVTGAIWANYAWGRAWGFDPKEMWSAVTWLIYVAYLHARLRSGWRGLQASALAFSGLLAMIVTYLLVNWLVEVFHLDSLHSYAD